MSGLVVFAACALILVLGYFVYGKVAERVYGVDYKMIMPCVRLHDGVDYVAMPVWRVFMIQLLNIAGLGPVFGALAGCLFGPAALLWIVLGCLLAGAVHDFLSAVACAEHDGETLPELVGRYLGSPARLAMRGLCIVLMLLVGVVFTAGPAGMLHALVSEVSVIWWSVIILGYYFLATILPINALIGRVYPFFGVLFIFMAVSLAVMLPLTPEVTVLPEFDMTKAWHPKNLSVWPMIFVTIACGAISGFHATQSPMMVRCMENPRRLRTVFYGAMVVEGLVALIWCVVGLSLRELATDYALVADTAGKLVPQLLQEGEQGVTFCQLTMVNPAVAVDQACTWLLGPVGAVIAVLGVVVLPITSGDTALRCCRLMLAEAFGLSQVSRVKRLQVALPVFACVIIISFVDFSVIWRYFGWANQALSCFTLWALAVLLRQRRRFHWIVTVPALFMTTVCTTYLLNAPDCGIELPIGISTAVGAVITILCAVSFLYLRGRATASGKN